LIKPGGGEGGGRGWEICKTETVCEKTSRLCQFNMAPRWFILDIKNLEVFDEETAS
jgi:hypothetical protein